MYAFIDITVLILSILYGYVFVYYPSRHDGIYWIATGVYILLGFIMLRDRLIISRIMSTFERIN